MKRLLLITLLTYSNLLMAGLPPTVLSGQSQTTNPTTFKFKVPYSQATQISGVESLIETGNENLLVNPGFEGSNLSAWTCGTGNTCSRTTSSLTFATGKSALKVIVTSGNPLNVYQRVTPPAGSLKQGFARIMYNVSSTTTDFRVCTRVATVEQTCVPSANLIADNTFRTIEIPIVFGDSTTADILVKTDGNVGADTTFYFDGAILAQGLGLQNLMTDYVYTFAVGGSGTVTQENKDFINGNCSLATNVFTCTFNTGLVTTAPNCTVTANPGATNGIGWSIDSISSTTLVYRSYTSTTGAANAQPVYVTCVKQGNDYLAASASIYSQASADTDWTACTFSTLAWQGLGTVTNNLQCRRNSGMLEMRGKFTTGTVAASLAQIPLPSNFGSLTSATTISTNEVGGILFRENATTNSLQTLILNPSVSYISIGGPVVSTSATPQTPVNGSTLFGSGEIENIPLIRIPIAGWSNSNVIVGSFENVPTTPGLSKSSLVSAVVSGTEVITENESAFITSCTDATPSVCTLTTSFFTATPKCWANPSASGTVATVSSRSTTSISIERTANTTSFTLFCQGAR